MRGRCCFDKFFHGCPGWQPLHSGLGSGYDPGFGGGSRSDSCYRVKFAYYI